MFKGCGSLSSISVEMDVSVFGTTTGSWLSGVSDTGTFYCPTALGTDETITRGMNYCPDNWTVINID